MRRAVASELMDDPDVDAAELAANFNDIERANALFGGIEPVARVIFSGGATRVLDVGCGSADIPRALARTARERGRVLDVVALDSSETVLSIARARSAGESRITFVRADATALPFPDDSFDVATCSLALHHFEPPTALLVLRELRRVARITPLVCDLVRSRLAYLATVAFARIVANNRLTKHDAPLSVKRAYTPREARELALVAGWKTPSVKRVPYFRMLLRDDAR